jgi:hypothetical protein
MTEMTSEVSTEALLARIAELEEAQHKAQVESRIAAFSEDWKDHPALLKCIQEIMLSDDGGPALLLSEEGSDDTQKLTASDIVERVMAAVPKPSIQLSEQVVKPMMDDPHPATHGDQLSVEERAAAARKAMGLDNKRLPRVD